MMFRRYGLYFAWLLALCGTLGSLYFSEVKHMEPCHLCWYQRIALYPLAIILGLATYNADLKIVRYTIPLALIGFCFAIYQVLIQEIPAWNPIDLCGAGPSCSEKHTIGLGPITIPMLSAFGFLLIAIFLIGAWFTQTKELVDKK